MALKKVVEKARQFSSLFLPELHAVQARRRRYRIERLLGFLPAAPAARPPPEEAAPPAGSARAGASSADLDQLFKTLRSQRDATEKAREKLRKARAPVEAQHETPSPGPPAAADAVLLAARAFKQAAVAWHATARRYRDQSFEEARQAAPLAARPGAEHSETWGAILARWKNAEAIWEQAEAILAAAARAVSEAANELRIEDRGRRGETAPEGPPPPAPAVQHAGLSRAYALVLSCEDAVRAALDAFHRAEPPDRPAAEERLCLLMLYLARAERGLFLTAGKCLGDKQRRADCRQAAAAASQEVQRASRRWCGACLARMGGGPPPGGTGGADGDGGSIPTPPAGPRDGEGGGPPDLLLARAREEALDHDLVGVALSGGGIRSATFALGFLQGLAQLRLLGIVDYLSTVSGGGYIGAWFAAWVQREGSLANVERQLSPNRVSQSQAARLGLPPGQPVDDEPEPVHHLRAYSRYLSPRFGLFSPDTWTLFTIYLRNLFVNALFILPLAVAAVFLWRVLLHGYDAPLRGETEAAQAGETWDWYSTGRLALSLVFAAAYCVGTWNLFREEEKLFEAELPGAGRARAAENVRSTHLYILFSLLVMAVVGSWLFSLEPGLARAAPYDKADLLRFFGQRWVEQYYRLPGLRDLPGWLGWVRVVSLFAICFVLPTVAVSALARTYYWLRRRGRLGRRTPWNGKAVVANAWLAACFALALYLVLVFVVWPLSYGAARGDAALLCLLHTVATPLIFAAMVVGGFGEMALVGRWLSEHQREWRGRLGALLLMGAAAWLLVGAAALFLPWLVEISYVALYRWLFPAGAVNPERLNYAWAALNAVLAALWGAVSGGGAWIVTRGATAAGPTQPRGWWLRALAFVAPFVFLLGLLGGVSAAGQAAVDALSGGASGSFLTRATHSWEFNWILILVSSVLVCVFGGLISVNRFSLHMLYANRLTRCYLGASRRKQVGDGSLGAPTGVPRTQPIRQRNLFSGFDPLDDFPLADMRTVGGPSRHAPYTGPLPLINVALNCLAGDELAYQDRRADAFVLTPEKCGGRLTGYADTPRDRPDAENLTAGRVMTISGAAVDPNMSGLSAPLTALMTVFNTRLGWWLENPRPDHRPWGRGGRPWGAAEPGFGWPLLWEFLGQTNEEREYVHLSDGGHFENLGVYELVRRRCRFIVVVDSGTDRTAASDNMAAMLRLVRTDFGVNIALDPSRMQGQGPSGYSEWHCAVGRIGYDEVDTSAAPGVLVYLQATLTGDEPPDLLQYVSRHPDFPRQTTLNQFFDEAQFECYRALGHHIAIGVFGEAAGFWAGQPQNAEQHRADVQAVFARVRQQWLPPVPCSEAAELTSIQLALQTEQQLVGVPELNDFQLETYPELKTEPPAAPAAVQVELRQFRAVSQALQVMEAAWSARRMEAFHAHPANRGWVSTFYRWTASRAFQRYWPFLRAEYSKSFVEFCEGTLNLQITRVVPVRVASAADLAAQQAAVGDLNLQFTQEWADQYAALGIPSALNRSDYIRKLTADAEAEAGTVREPFIWLLRGGSPTGHVCGIACAVRSAAWRALLEPAAPKAAQRRAMEEAEFFFWLRGPYRSLGVGTKVLRRILREIDEDSAYTPLPAGPWRRLAIYHPLSRDGAGGRLALERWMTFFFDHGFRRIVQPDTGVGAAFAVLKRELNP